MQNNPGSEPSDLNKPDANDSNDESTDVSKDPMTEEDTVSGGPAD